MGRKTYEQAGSFERHPFAGKKCYVFSRTISKSPVENVYFIHDQIPDFIQRIKSERGKDIWLVGGAEIIEVFLNQNRIDRLILSIHPVLLGTGIPLFQNLRQEVNLKLKESLSFDGGLVQLHYEVLKS